MNMFDSVLWTALGFIATLAAMEVAWRMGRERSAKHMVEVRAAN